MTTRLVRACAAIAVVLACPAALAQEIGSAPVPPAEAEKTWSFSASAYTYFVPDENDFVSPVVTADRGWLHLEARYDYEGFRTGAIWFGYNFSVEKRWPSISPRCSGASWGHPGSPRASPPRSPGRPSCFRM